MSTLHAETNGDSAGGWSKWEWDNNVKQYFSYRFNTETRKMEYRYENEKSTQEQRISPAGEACVNSSSAPGSSISLSLRIPTDSKTRTSPYNMAAAGDTPNDGHEGASKAARTSSYTHIPDNTLDKDIIDGHFACPYWKKYPELYQNWRPCSGPGLTIIHLKKHVRKCHRLPIRCLRCSEVFDNKLELEVHCQTDVPCTKRASKQFPGFNDEQERKIADLDSFETLKQSEEEQWTCMFRILFPHDQDLPSPFYPNCNIWVKSKDSTNQTISAMGSTVLAMYELRTGAWEDPFSAEKYLSSQTGRGTTLSCSYSHGMDPNGIPRLVFPSDNSVGQLHLVRNGHSAHSDRCARHRGQNRRCSTSCLARKRSSRSSLDGTSNLLLLNLSNTDFIQPVEHTSHTSNKIPADILCLGDFSKSEWAGLPAAVDTEESLDDQLSVMQIDDDATSEELSEYWDTGEFAAEEDELQCLHQKEKSVIIRDALVNYLLTKSYQISYPPACKKCGDNVSSSSAASNIRRGSMVEVSPSSRHKHSRDRDGSFNGEDDDQRKRMKPEHSSDIHFHGRSEKLACPFFQRSPLKYQNVTCVGPGFADIKRLKEHLKRQHLLPLHCRRCWAVFKSNQDEVEKQKRPIPPERLEQAREADEAERDAHVESPKGCQPRPDQALEGLKNSQLQRLFDKNKFGPDLSLEGKWNVVYRMIWPKDTKIPSAFYQYFSITESGITPLFEMEITCEYREYFRVEHPRLLSERFREIFNHDQSMLVPGFENSLEQIYRECEEQVKTHFNNRNKHLKMTTNPLPETSVAPHSPTLQGAVTPRSSSPGADTPEAVSTPLAEPLCTDAEVNRDIYDYDFASSQFPDANVPQLQNEPTQKNISPLKVDAMSSSFAEQDFEWTDEPFRNLVDWDKFDEDIGLSKSS